MAMMISSPEKIKIDNAPVIGAKKEGETDDHNGAAEESQPEDLGNDTGGHGEPVATRLSDAVQLVEDLSQKGRFAPIAGRETQNISVQIVQCAGHAGTCLALFHGGPVLGNRNLEILGGRFAKRCSWLGSDSLRQTIGGRRSA